MAGDRNQEVYSLALRMLVLMVVLSGDWQTANSADCNATVTNAVNSNEVGGQLAEAQKASMLHVQLLDSWEPDLWYTLSHVEQNAEKGSIQQTQYQEELIATSSEVQSPLAPYKIRPIDTVGVDIGRKAGLTPLNRAIADGVFDDHPSTIAMRTWPITTRTWTAPKTRHRPLYFEEVNAERYGYTCSRFLQPVLSSVHFFGTVPYLPYLMTADPPCQCNYTLGHYRPGSCPPYRKHCWPFSAKGAGIEAAVAVGMIALIP